MRTTVDNWMKLDSTFFQVNVKDHLFPLLKVGEEEAAKEERRGGRSEQEDER